MYKNPGLFRSDSIIRYVVALLAFIVGGWGFASSDLAFRHYGFSEGLDFSTMSDLHLDDDGMLWISSGAGLRRFDGYKFHRYTHNPADPTTISHQNVSGIFQDSRKRIWFGTNSGLCRYIPEKDYFERYSVGDSVAVFRIIERPGNVLMLGTSQGLMQFNPENGASELFMPEAPWAGQAIRALLCDSNNNFWIGTWRKGLYCLTNEGEIRYYPGLPQRAAIWDLCFDSQGVLWVASVEGLHRLDGLDADLTIVEMPEAPNNDPKENVRCIMEDRDGWLWVGSTFSGLVRFSPDRKTRIRYRHNPSHPYSLSSDRISRVEADKNGTLWLGTIGGGLNRYDPSFNRFSSLFVTRDGASLSHGYTKGITEDFKGNIWVATAGGGLNRWRPETGDIQHFNTTQEGRSYLNNDFLMAVHTDDQGRVFVSSRKSGVWLGNIEDGNFQEFQPEVFESQIVYDFLERSNGDLIFASLNCQILPKGEDRVKPFPMTFHVENAIGVVSYDLYERRNGQLLVGSMLDGYFYEQHGKMVNERHDPANPRSLSSNDVFDFYEDSQGRLWVATRFGLNLMKDEGVYKRFTPEDGLPGALVCRLLPGNDDELWMSTNAGLARLDMKTMDITSFTVKDGLGSNEYNTGSSFKSRDGTLYFGNMAGVTYFKADDINLTYQKPHVLLDELLLFNEPIKPQSDGSQRFNRTLSHMSELELTHEDRIVGISFLGLKTLRPDRLRYYYKMENLYNTWLEPPEGQRVASFTSIPSGSFVFRVKAQSEDGQWSEEARLPVRVKPAPWASPLAFAFYILLVLGAVFGYIFFLKRVNQHLESAVEERTRTLKEAQDALVVQEKLSAIHGLSAGIAHEIRNPLNFVNNFTDVSLEMVEEVREVLEMIELERDQRAELSEILGGLDENLSRVRHHGDRAARIVSAVVALNRHKADRPERYPFNRMVQEMTEACLTRYSDSPYQCYDLQVDYVFDPKVTRVTFSMRDIGRALENLIINALQSMSLAEVSKPKLTIGTGIEKGCPYIDVLDRGPGIPEEERQRIFEPFYTTRAGIDFTGLGLAVAHDIVVKIHGGQLKLMPNQTGGAHFRIVLKSF